MHGPIRTTFRIYWDDTFSGFHHCIRLGWRSEAAVVTFFGCFFSESDNHLLFVWFSMIRCEFTQAKTLNQLKHGWECCM